MPRRRDRWMKMSEVAELMGLQHKDMAERRRYIRRLLRRLEQRDGTKYVRRFSDGRNSPWFVALSALEQLMPWDPGTLTKIREDVSYLGTRVKRVERGVAKNKNDIVRMQEFQRRTAELLRDASMVFGPK